MDAARVEHSQSAGTSSLVVLLFPWLTHPVTNANLGLETVEVI